MCAKSFLSADLGDILVPELVALLVVGLTPLKLKPPGSRVHSVVRGRL